MSEPTTPGRGLSRRRLFGLPGAGTAGVVAAGAAGGAIGRATVDGPASAVGPGPTDAVEFTGVHQAGIVTPAQDRLHFVALDVHTRRDATFDGAVRSSLLGHLSVATVDSTAQECVRTPGLARDDDGRELDGLERDDDADGPDHGHGHALPEAAAARGERADGS